MVIVRGVICIEWLQSIRVESQKELDQHRRRFNTRSLLLWSPLLIRNPHTLNLASFFLSFFFDRLLEFELWRVESRSQVAAARTYSYFKIQCDLISRVQTNTIFFVVIGDSGVLWNTRYAIKTLKFRVMIICYALLSVNFRWTFINNY